MKLKLKNMKLWYHFFIKLKVLCVLVKLWFFLKIRAPNFLQTVLNLEKRSAKSVNIINENRAKFTNEIKIIKLNSKEPKKKPNNRLLNTSLSIINKNDLDVFDNNMKNNNNIDRTKSISMTLTKKILANNSQKNNNKTINLSIHLL